MWYMPKDHKTDDEIETEDEFDLGDLGSWLPEHTAESGASGIGTGSQWTLGESQESQIDHRARIARRITSFVTDIGPILPGPDFEEGASYEIAQDAFQAGVDLLRAFPMPPPTPELSYVFKFNFQQGGYKTAAIPRIDLRRFAYGVPRGGPYPLSHFHLARLRREIKTEIVREYQRLQSVYGDQGVVLGPLISVETIAMIHNITDTGAGCASKSRVKNIKKKSDKTIIMKVYSPKNTQNSCGISCVLEFLKRSGRKIKQRAASIKKEMKLSKLDMITLKDFDFLAEKFDICVRILDSDFEELYKTPGKKEVATLVRVADHYVLSLEKSKNKATSSKTQKEYNDSYREYHITDSGKQQAKLFGPSFKNNNSGIVCLRYCLKKLGDPISDSVNDIKKSLSHLGVDDNLTLDDFDVLGKRYDVEITVWDRNFKIIKKTEKKDRVITLVFINDVFKVLLSQPVPIKPKERTIPECVFCGKVKPPKNHPCFKGKHKKIRFMTIEKHRKMLLAQRENRERNLEMPIGSSDDDILNTRDLKNARKNYLFHGPGGTGKSRLIHQIYTKYRKVWGYSEHQVRLTATTGLAAINIKGITLHNLFNMHCSDHQLIYNSIVKEYWTGKLNSEGKRIKESKHETLSKLLVLIIDEISMLSQETWMLLNMLLKTIKKTNTPFGGVKLLLFGDFCQLPPVVPGQRNPRYIFETDLWQEFQKTGLIVKNLTKGWRYLKDPEWYKMLKRIRTGNADQLDFEKLKSKLSKLEPARERLEKDSVKYAVLFGKRLSTNDYNTNIFNQTIGEEIKFPHTDSRAAFSFKVGIKTMLIKNIKYKRKSGTIMLPNGIVGTISDFNLKRRTIELDINAKQIQGVFTIGYEMIDGKMVMPLKFQWALTVHKVQGQTLDGVIIDASGRTKKELVDASGVRKTKLSGEMWAPAHFYVAVSRASSFENVYFTKLDLKNVNRVNPRAVEFNRWCENWISGQRWKKTNRINDVSYKIQNSKLNTLYFSKKKPYHDMLLKHTVLFDAETFPTERGFQKMYHLHLQYFSKGRLALEKTFCQLCTPDVDVSDSFSEFILGIILKIAKDKTNKRMPYEKNVNLTPLTICAFNGSRFDFHFLMQKLKRDSRTYRLDYLYVSSGSHIKILKIYDKLTGYTLAQFHDICNVLHCSLADGAKYYANDSSVGKGIFPHRWVNPDNLALAKNIDSKVTIQFEDFFEKDYFNLQEAIKDKSIDLNNYPFHANLHSYCKNDVDVMYKLYTEVEKITQTEKLFSTSILRFSTASQAAYYGFKKNLSSQFIRTDPLALSEKITKTGHQNKETLIFLMTRREDLFWSRAIMGGRCYPRIKSFVSEVADLDIPYENIKPKDARAYLDVNGMYSFCMQHYFFPYGQHEEFGPDSDEVKELKNKILGNFRNLDPLSPDQELFLVDVTYEMHPFELEPCVGQKTLMNRNSSLTPRFNLSWDIGKHRGPITSIDLYLILKNQGKIHDVHKMIVWPCKDKIFKNWMDICISGKTRSKKEKNPAQYQFYKLLANATYGCVMQKDYDESTHFIRSENDLDVFFEDYSISEAVNFQQYIANEDAHLILKGKRDVDLDFEYCRHPRQLSIFNLGWTRYLWDQYVDGYLGTDRRAGTLDAVKKQMLYSDTDSMILPFSAIETLKRKGYIHPTKPGCLSDDIYSTDFPKDATDEEMIELMKFAKIIKFFGPQPKVYALQAVLPSAFRKIILEKGVKKEMGRAKEIEDQIKQKEKEMGKSIDYEIRYLNGIRYKITPNRVLIDLVKMKGFPKHNVDFELGGMVYNEMTCDRLEEAIASHSESGLRVNMGNRMKKKGTSISRKDHQQKIGAWDILSTEMFRTLFRTNYSGRLFLPDNNLSVPLSWKGECEYKIEEPPKKKRRRQKKKK